MRGSRGAFALALAAVAFACLASGGADAQAPARGNAWEATGPQKTKVTDNCVFLFKVSFFARSPLPTTCTAIF